MKEFLLLRSEDDVEKILNLEYYSIVETDRKAYEETKEIVERINKDVVSTCGENSVELEKINNTLNGLIKEAEAKINIRRMEIIEEWLDCFLDEMIECICVKVIEPEANPIFNILPTYSTDTKASKNALWAFNECLAEDAELLKMVKKDILCLVALTCHYWKAEKKTSKKLELKNDIQIDRIAWEIDLETKVNSAEWMIETKDFLINLKKMIIENPDIWNRKSKKAMRNRYKIEKLIMDEGYKNLNAEEQYFYQYITGFPIAIELFAQGKKLDYEEVGKFIDAVCCIKGVHVRWYLTEQYCDKKSGSNLAECLIKYDGAEQIGYEIMQFAWAFLKILISSFSEKNEQEWSDNVFNKIQRNYQLLDKNKAKTFWLTDDFLTSIENIKVNTFGDTRNRANANYTELQKKIKDKIISNGEKNDCEINFPAYFNMSQIVRADEN